jgi:predicted phage terminase large subunit-like protein
MVNEQPDRLPAWCAACRTDQPLNQFRRLRDWPLLYVDFCQTCEKAHGTVTLYENPDFKSCVSRVAKKMVLDGDLVSAKVEKRALSAREEQQRELARRELMRRRLAYYVTQFRQDYQVGWVHQDICRRLERFVEQVERGESPRLMLFCPPRLGKSTLSSKEFVSWVLGKHPEWEIISGSYAISLPIGFSREIRDRLKAPEYAAVFPDAKLRPDAANVESWRLTGGGGYLATGVGGGITGFGAHILDLDDVVKDSEAASSETIRQNTYDWYQTTARTRLAPGGGVVLTMTRWHDADLAGRLLADQQAAKDAGLPLSQYEQWEVVSYSALADYDEYLMPSGEIEQEPAEIPEGARLLRKAGDALHPARYDRDALIRLKNSMPAGSWNALYQQNPVPDTGEFFTADQFRTYSTLPGRPEDYAYFMAWDLAIGEKQSNDWTVGSVGALHMNGDLYVVDMIRARFNTLQIIDALVGLARKWPLMQRAGLEDGQIKKTMQPILERAIQKEKLLFSLDETLKPVTDKLVRARPLQQKMQMGQVYFPVGQPWVSKAQAEMLRFPSGVHDDVVDSLAWLVRMSFNISAPVPAGYKDPAQRKSWKDKLKKHSVGSAHGHNYMTA